MHFGRLLLKELSVAKVKGISATKVKVMIDDHSINTILDERQGHYVLTFDAGVTILKDQVLRLNLT